ncbi:UDP-N-acetylmuramoyl-tripeptide--D-alanyl-D-alanine ligase [Nocardioides baekrokdamisoli]|uniref:UDP-N-acetylmuramoyl-tripeptide--D-alanyl-D-alanine ligase n=1 Tax=Nocardioides baekrokdamisoli TaxID=1804624 RepID=A0A3G9IGK0_9ACTN|nr:UDP-N-acetylmuramoyl-tripeptide--D-alanyl-D-alanine ligase [Nocardioides baekrokdamisoli]BBH18180.1 UDP-N-acetylmuramoyl-tripeptide--D-alanyl-D-alanine ligase [Nocardioides baekrokdamisoli]
MIALSLSEIADIVDGELVGADVTIDGPVVIDSREAGPRGLFAAFVGEHVDGHDYVEAARERGAVAVLGSRATSLPTVIVADPQRALQRLASHVVGVLREADFLTVLAVTGSQGKTSTKDLLAAVLAAEAPTVATAGSYNNELGVPITALRATRETRFLLLEMGARGVGHLRELTDLIAPDVPIVLNVGTAHLGEFGSRDAIALAKSELVSGMAEGGIAILNADDPAVSAMAVLAPEDTFTFGTGADADVRVVNLRLDSRGRPSFRLHTGQGDADVSLRLVGAHQAMNAAAAAAAALIEGVPLETVVEALGQVTELSKWRMELTERDGITFLNDAYNANPESMRAGLDALATIGAADDVTRTVAVLGEMKELGAESEDAHRSVGAYAASIGIDSVVVIGEPARGTHDAFPGSVFLSTNDEAVDWLRGHLRTGDAVLFKASNGARLYEVAEALR